MNFIAAKTLLAKEIKRFLRVPGQTVLGPLVSTLLYFLVFAKAPFAEHARWNEQPYLAFIFPGLLFLTVANGALLNTSSSILISKIQGPIVDLLTAPMGALELLLGWVGGAMARGLLLGALTVGMAALFIPLSSIHWLSLFFLAALVAYVFALLGVLTGLWADSFEQVNLVPTFFLMPMAFLGGIFYEVHRLPAPFDSLSLLNPVVFIVDALRAATFGHPLWGHGPSNACIGLCILLVLAALSSFMAVLCLRRGYKLRA
ncbi:MAG: ABC transporter permease [Cystobacterineae bacterium]|nr:ABC transporter permease [Cystobacterineae bacterium]